MVNVSPVINSIKGETFAYKIKESLYLNVTNRCTNACSFCIRSIANDVSGYNLRLHREPCLDEMTKSIMKYKQYKEIVFCGYGEPFLRTNLIKELSVWIKDRLGVRIRINTNGHGNVINKRNILTEMNGMIDSLSVSLNAQNACIYNSLCRPRIDDAYSSVVDFIKESTNYIPDVTATAVDVPGVDSNLCKKIAHELNVKFRLRKFSLTV